MASTLHPAPPAAMPTRSAPTPTDAPAGHALASPRAHALFAPLFLFAHGILGWVDAIDGRRGGPLWVAGQLALVASMVSFGGLAVGLSRRTGLRASVIGLAAVLIGAAGIIPLAAERIIAGPSLQVPTAVAVAGPLLLAAGLLALLRHLVSNDEYAAGSLGLIALGALAMAAPLDLLPLGALLVLIGLGPLTHPLDASGPDPRREHLSPASR